MAATTEFPIASWRLRLRLAAVGFFAVLILLLAPSGASACTCVGSPPACEALWASPLVFSGTVLDVTPVGNELGEQFPPWRRVRFRVETMWRGTPGAELKVMTGSSGGDCGYNFQPGGRYLVYTYRRNGVPWTGICSRTQRLAEADQDLAYLATAHTPAAAGRIFGTAEYSRGSGTRHRKPATGFIVTLRSGEREWHEKTGADGRYEFAAMPPGRYSISIALQPGERVYAPATLELLDARGCAAADFSIVGSGTVSFRTVTARGEPASGIRLEIIDAETLADPLPSYRSAVTDGSGQARFTELPPGRYVVVSNFRLPPSKAQPYWRVFHPGTSEQTAATVVNLATGQDLELGPLTLPEPLLERIVHGIVVWPDGSPASRAWVTALPVNTVHYAADVRTDAAGRFSLRVLHGVRYAITAHQWVGPERTTWLSPDVEVQPAAENEALTLVLAPFKR